MSLLSVFSSSKRSTSEEKFWIWFVKNQEMLLNFQKNQSRAFRKLKAAISKVHPDLTFEFGFEDGDQMEFVISADGLKDAFPAVESLYSKAPQLPDWKFTKFRPRREPMAIEFEGVKLSPDDLRVSIGIRDSRADLVVYVGSFERFSEEHLVQMVFLMLDQAVGEYDVENKIGQIDVMPLDESSGQKLIAFEDLPNELDRLL